MSYQDTLNKIIRGIGKACAVRGKDFSVDTHGEYVCVDVRAMLVMWCVDKGVEL